ncbi:MAG: peptidylprolyl isomerase [bacterium]|nr:peptidylprolyl isomerase [bacterium]
MSRRKQHALIVAAAALIVTACGGSDEDAASGGETADTATTTTTTSAPAETVPEITLPPRPPSDYAGFAAQETACGADAPTPVTLTTFDAPEDQGLDPETIVVATITTSCGDIVVELDPGVAPETVNSFVFLARSGYFDGSVSHRVIPGFVIQAGDPTATGREGPGYTIPDELPEAGFVYPAGGLAMANAGPDTTGSQFFIVLADAPLPNAYSYFGEVASGQETIDKIALIPLGPNAFGETSVPLQTLYIESVSIAE